MSFEPKIIAFCCNWCSYAAADLAGVSRMQYPHNVRIIRVMCSGMVHPEFVMDSLEQGADGVMVLGWHLGECHYLDGNYKTANRSTMITTMLEEMGYEKDRYNVTWVSSAEPDKFAKSVTEFTQVIKKLGPVQPETAANAA